MLRFDFEGGEWFNESDMTFLYTSECHVELEHSLLSLSKWESKWKLPFLSTYATQCCTKDQMYSYFHCMELVPCGEINWTRNLSNADVQKIMKYITEDQTATTFHNYGSDKAFSREIITSELIYYWMSSLNIPYSCETWHFSRLLTLIRVASIKGQPGKMMPKKNVRRMYAEINAKRRQQYGTKG